jgi:hypothetical protein
MLEVALPMGPPAAVAPLVVNVGAVPIGDLLAGEASVHPATPCMAQQRSKVRRAHCLYWLTLMCLVCMSLVAANRTSMSVATMPDCEVFLAVLLLPAGGTGTNVPTAPVNPQNAAAGVACE